MAEVSDSDFREVFDGNRPWSPAQWFAVVLMLSLGLLVAGAVARIHFHTEDKMKMAVASALAERGVTEASLERTSSRHICRNGGQRRGPAAYSWWTGTGGGYACVERASPHRVTIAGAPSPPAPR